MFRASCSRVLCEKCEATGSSLLTLSRITIAQGDSFAHRKIVLVRGDRIWENGPIEIVRRTGQGGCPERSLGRIIALFHKEPRAFVVLFYFLARHISTVLTVSSLSSPSAWETIGLNIVARTGLAQAHFKRSSGVSVSIQNRKK